MNQVAATTESIDELLCDAAARTVVLQLHYEDQAGSLAIGKTRIRNLTGTQILADAISYVDDHERIPSGRLICAHFMIRGKRLQFQTVLEADRATIVGPGRERVLGVALRRPQRVTASQRRTHVRVSVSAGDPIQVHAAPSSLKTSNACPIDACHYVGRMLNLSAGGMTVLFHSEELRKGKMNDRFFLTFTLPDAPGEFYMLGSLRHARKVESSDSWRISYAFKPWEGSSLRSDQHRITQFIAQREREYLRRRK